MGSFLLTFANNRINVKINKIVDICIENGLKIFVWMIWLMIVKIDKNVN